MLAKINSFGILGIDAYAVVIEVDVSKGLPATHIVGLPDNAVKESKERVRSAIKNSGYKYPAKRITVNLTPADTKKEGPAYDLAIAIGILVATEQINHEYVNDYAFLGSLSLDGHLQPIKGTLTFAMALNKGRDVAMQRPYLKGLLLPESNRKEASIYSQEKLYAAQSLNDAALFLDCPSSISPIKTQSLNDLIDTGYSDIDFCEVKGQTLVKRGLEIAAAGGHNVLLVGPPGSGKSMLAKRLPSILPDMTLDESIETTKIHSVMGYLKGNQGIIRRRPFRSPHHTTSDVAIVGGGSIPKPGEVTLSHNGVLFLDELPEFRRNVLESLRQPLEDQCVTIARANQTINFPSKFMFVASMNPCPCGWLTDPKRECHCNQIQIQKYLGKISGPLLDRIDIHLEVPSLSSLDLMKNDVAENSADIKLRTVAARNIQLSRFQSSKAYANAFMNHKQIKTYCSLDDECKKLLKMAITELKLSARAYDKILRVARTIADLAEKKEIAPDHLCEAIQYRYLDRDWWG